MNPRLHLVTPDLAEITDDSDHPEPLAEILVGTAPDGTLTVEVTKHSAREVRLTCGATLMAVSTEDTADDTDTIEGAPDGS